MATVKPIDPRRAVAAPPPLPPTPAEPPKNPALARRVASAPAPAPASVARSTPGTTLDGSWDKRLSRGMIQPDATVDLHGHTLNSAYAMLDDALGRSIARGDRVILLITGKPPRPDSERPHARGAIRATVGDWLHSSRHADSIAAVRGANPRHGGSGALSIVLRRPRGARIS
jgi:DNA-nicking Smr family endonuclease